MHKFILALHGLEDERMLSDLFRGFTATQKTIVIVAAIVTPGALYGAVTFQPVAIVDPITGVNSSIDSSRRLSVYDPIAGYTNNPINYVRISGVVAGDNIYHVVYTVPTGKALILRGANLSYFNGVFGNNNHFYLTDSFATGSSFVVGFDDPNVSGTHNAALGNGWFFHSSDTIQYISFNGSSSVAAMNTSFSLEGFLVPAILVPARASMEAAQQIVQVGDVSKK